MYPNLNCASPCSGQRNTATLQLSKNRANFTVHMGRKKNYGREGKNKCQLSIAKEITMECTEVEYRVL